MTAAAKLACSPRPRRLRFTPVGQTPLAQNGRHQFALRQAMAVYPSAAIYSRIPKNGSTGLRVAVGVANGVIDGVQHDGWIGGNPIDTYAAVTLAELARARFTFVVLRDPFTRLSSAYLDKIVARKPELWPFLGATGGRLRAEDVTFRRFVETVTTNRSAQANPHWRPQEDFLVYETYDAVIPLERLHDHAGMLRERAGLDVVDALAVGDNQNARFTTLDDRCYADARPHDLFGMQGEKNRSPAHAAMYDDELRERVAEAYAADLALHRNAMGAAVEAVEPARPEPAVDRQASEVRELEAA